MYISKGSTLIAWNNKEIEAGHSSITQQVFIPYSFLNCLFIFTCRRYPPRLTSHDGLTWLAHAVLQQLLHYPRRICRQFSAPTHRQHEIKSLLISLERRGSTRKSHFSRQPMSVVVWCSGSALVSINEVNLRRTRLVLRWVTVSGFNSRCRRFIRQPNVSRMP